MSEFTADWLALREPFDTASRATALVEPLRLALPPERPIRIIDLGCGTGANLRWLAPRLAGDQDWLLLDNDAALLEGLPDRLRAWAEVHDLQLQLADAAAELSGPAGRIAVRWQSYDLGAGLPADGAAPAALVTASALLDLLSAAAADHLMDGCVASGATVYLTLSYNGSIVWTPPDPFDGSATEALNRHQRGDKGLGPALGPDAAAHVGDRLRQAGYAVRQAASDWRLSPTDRIIQRALLADWSDAAAQAATDRALDIDDWMARRESMIAAGRSHLRVGHVDLLATAPSRNGP